jgi:hypothetical protein
LIASESEHLPGVKTLKEKWLKYCNKNIDLNRGNDLVPFDRDLKKLGKQVRNIAQRK